MGQGYLESRAQLEKLCFVKFLSVISRQPTRLMDPHWRKQSDFMYGHYSHYFSFEQFPVILDFLAGLGVAVRPYHPHATSGEGSVDWNGLDASRLTVSELRHLRAEGATPSPRDLVTDEIAATWSGLYADDYALIRRTKFV